MKKSIILFTVMAVAVCMGAISCSKDDPKDDPKKEQPVEVADVFFSAENGDYCYYIGASGTPEAKLTVIRSNSTIAAEYAIKVLSADKGVTVPESIKFAEGQTSTTLTITAPAGSAPGTVLSFEIMFTGENVNSAANSTEGTLRCEGTFYFYQERVACACFVPYGTGNISDYMGNMKQVVWQLDANTFILKDFLGNGNDLKIILDPATNEVKNFVYSGYDLFSEIDEYGGTNCYFYDAATDTYETFAPKGNRRIISTLSLYLASGYSAFVDGDTPYIYITVPAVAFYSEADGINNKEFYWQYFCLYFYSDATLSTLDFTGFPEVESVSYPEAVYSEDAKDGLVPIQVYLENEGIDLDTQYGTITETGIEIPNFMYSDCTLKIILNTNSADLEMYGAEGKLVSGAVDAGYISLGVDYVWPWINNTSWCMYGLSIYNDPSYRLYYPDTKMVQVWGGYTIYDGDSASWMADQEGYIDIYW